ncbi:MAG: mitochondrial fission ELM1 family protein [Candidatus Omnitrophica bacterium]|nr:mitochondrial fission ELM1 family protein [Candidatus Omnitrophota bacterium]
MKILVLDDGIPGNTNQSIGVAEALQQNYDIINVQFRGFSYKLPAREGKVKIAPKIIGLFLNTGAHPIAYMLLKLFSKEKMPKDHYDVVISTGSLLAPINLLISRKNKSKSVCIMTPECIKLKKFDLLIVPLHDVFRHPLLKKLKNVFCTIGAPNRVTTALLKESGEKLRSKIQIPEKAIRVGLIIGGNDQNYFIDVDWTRTLFEKMKKLNKEKLVFFLTASRRTPLDVIKFLVEQTNTADFVYREFPGTKTGLHYFGILALCDVFFVTEDSITMISEACSTGKPVIVVGVKRRKKKKLIFDNTINYLVKHGYCAYVAADELDKINDCFYMAIEKKVFPYLNESKKCAQKILELMGLKES